MLQQNQNAMGDPSIQVQCEKCIDVWLRGDRCDAVWLSRCAHSQQHPHPNVAALCLACRNDAGPTKQALLQLIQQHPKDSLPRRYLVSPACGSSRGVCMLLLTTSHQAVACHDYDEPTRHVLVIHAGTFDVS